jgi:hypothetical protein
MLWRVLERGVCWDEELCLGSSSIFPPSSLYHAVMARLDCQVCSLVWNRCCLAIRIRIGVMSKMVTYYHDTAIMRVGIRVRCVIIAGGGYHAAVDIFGYAFLPISQNVFNALEDKENHVSQWMSRRRHDGMVPSCGHCCRRAGK